MNNAGIIALAVGGFFLYLKVMGIKIFGERIDVQYSGGFSEPVLELNPHMQAAYREALKVFTPYDAIITSHTGGTHNPGSLHPSGFAIDLRTRHLPGGSMGATAREFAGALRLRLGPAYDVVLESDHLHIEYDPA